MFKKIRWYLHYRKIIHDNKNLLLTKHNLKIDWVNRLYKTVTLSDDDIQEVKIIGSKYVNIILKNDSIKIQNTFIQLGIFEFVNILESKQLNKTQFGVAYNFKFLDIPKITIRIIWFSISFFSTFSLYLLNLGLKSVYFGLLFTLILYLITRFIKINRIENNN